MCYGLRVLGKQGVCYPHGYGPHTPAAGASDALGHHKKNITCVCSRVERSQCFGEKGKSIESFSYSDKMVDDLGSLAC